jgi:integrase
MSSSLQFTPSSSGNLWQMPLIPANYDCRPLTEEEHLALKQYADPNLHTSSAKALAARKVLARFELPLADVFQLRYQGKYTSYILQRFMRLEMYHHGKAFWNWKPNEWFETLCPTAERFEKKHGHNGLLHMAVLDTAYLLGKVSDLQSVGIVQAASSMANIYFGAEFVTQQCKKVIDTLVGKGYFQNTTSCREIRRVLCVLFLLKRTPYLEDITEELFERASESGAMRYEEGKIRVALQDLKIFSSKTTPPIPHAFPSWGMAREWYEWCIAWYDQTVDLNLNTRRHATFNMLVIGRWLHQHAPDVRTPEQWTEELAFRFRRDICSWTQGQYGGERVRHQLASQGSLDKLLSPSAIAHYLTELRRYLTDFTRRPYAVAGASARKIRLDFSPKEVLTAPDPIKRAIDEANPRDIDVQIWAKLAIAAATLAESDLPKGVHYSLNFYRALGLVWVTSARRPNEIARLRLDCLREEWNPDMRDEDNHPIPRFFASERSEESPGQPEKNVSKMYYLHIPSNKSRGPFWIWIPDYVADAIEIWKCERPRFQHQLFDPKDREKVDYLFCCRNKQVGSTFINESLIPVLCAKAGVDNKDAKGRITGHRGRSSRLTLLRNRGVGLDDLAEYAGHADTRTIRRYARQDPILLHRIIRDADDVSRLVEGVVDMHAAAQGLPALRWFIGYDADGEPMYCGNQIYVTCPHRLNCERCGMFIGGEKAKLLREGEQTLPVTSQVPMTPLEKCVVKGDQVGAEACRAALQQISAPETPDVRLIFNPEGLSNHELTKLAELGTAEALEKLQQALDAHVRRLTEAQQSKTGRNALVGAQKKCVKLLQDLVADCEQRMNTG